MVRKSNSLDCLKGLLHSATLKEDQKQSFRKDCWTVIVYIFETFQGGATAKRG